MKTPQKMASLIGLYILNSLIFLGTPHCRAQIELSGDRIVIQNIDHSMEKVRLLFVIGDYKERPTSVYIIQKNIVNESYKSFYTCLVRSDDPDWKLVASDNVDFWHWKLEKTICLQYRNVTDPRLTFPFEVFNLSFYIAANGSRSITIPGYEMPRSFTAGTEVPNFSVSISQEDLDFPEDFPIMFIGSHPPFRCVTWYARINISIFHNWEYRGIILMLYVVLFIVIAGAILLYKKRDKILLSDFLRISSSLLIFLPVFFFTFRNSIAPDYLTPFDALCFLSAIIYGCLLLWKISGLGTQRKDTQKSGVWASYE